MSFLGRRRFLKSTALCTLSLGLPRFVLGAQSSSTNVASKARQSMKITDIEIHEILLPYHDYNSTWLFRYQGIGTQLRTIYIVKTDLGLEGYGEAGGPAQSREQFAKYLGTDPFDWLADTENLAINMAIYDLMGKYLGLPAWKFLGPKVRSWVPVAAWTMSQPPEAMAEEVKSVSQRGYRWMKYHVDVFQNVTDQTAAMQKVAPPGFKVHYDFNANSDFEAVYPVLKELEKFPVAGRIEDPLPNIDHEGYRILREKCRLSILVHHAPHDFFMQHNLCDGYMAGHAPIGHALKVAALAEATNTPFMLQQIGGAINQAFLAHEAAVFKMATLDHVNVCHLWKDDITVETMPVIGGSVAVPDGPGLGVTIDRGKLEKYSKAPRPKQGRFLVRMRFVGGPYIYFRFDSSVPLNRLGFNLPGPVPGYGNPVRTDFWDEEGSGEFERMWKQTEPGPAWTDAKDLSG
jgi:L-alanine-DL-glutamate epimerase-like enolase superfamily enzyme